MNKIGKHFLIAITAGLLCIAVSASAQGRFSGAVESNAKVYVGGKTGGAFGLDALAGYLNENKTFVGIGIGYDRGFLQNEQYSPVELDPNLSRSFWDFSKPKVLKYGEVPLFLNLKRYFSSDLSGWNLDLRAGISYVFSPEGLGGTFWSSGVGYRFNLYGDTGIVARAFYEMKNSFHADDMYKSTLGRYHALGLRVSYEF